MIEQHLSWAASLLNVKESLEKIRTLPFETAQAELSAYKEASRQKGRRLLGIYHPDRNPENADRFKALNSVLQQIEKMVLKSRPKVIYSVTYYPPSYPSSGTATVTRAFSKRTYDARRAVNLRPKG